MELLAELRVSDAAMAMLGLFLFSTIIERLTNKGPMLWPIMGIIPTLFFHLDHIYDWVTAAVNRSGGTFSYRGMWLGGAYGVLTIDPANVEYMLKTRFVNFPKGRYYRERFSDFLGDGIFNADDGVWKEQRRAATAEMHSGRFVEYSAGTVSELVHQKLLKLLEKSEDCVIDLQDLFLRFTFDNICMAAFGVDPGCLAVDLPEITFAKAFEQATELTLFRFIVPPFVWKPMRFLGVGSEKHLNEAIRIVHQFAEKTVSDRRNEFRKLSGLKERFDLLSRLIETQEEEEEEEEIGVKATKYKFSNKFIKDFCISFILAGRDTSSVALSWFFWLLHKHPKVENSILREIEAVIARRKSKSPIQFDDIIFTIDELKKMDYLQASLSEALRLYPSVPVDFKEVLEDDIFPDGTAVKKGARVMYSMYSMGRSEGIWGKDCLEFKPERWLKEGEFVSENQFKYPVFNAGPRLCIGKKFAYMQMKMVAASILWRYSVSVVEGQEVKPKMTTTLYMKNGLLVKFNPRRGGN